MGVMMRWDHAEMMVLIISFISWTRTHSWTFSRVTLPLFYQRWQKGRSVLDSSHVHSPSGNFPTRLGPPTLTQVTANLSLHPHEVDPVKSLQAEQLASMMGLPDFFSRSQLGPQSMTSRLALLPALLQEMVEPHLKRWESAAQYQLQFPHDFPQAVVWSQKLVRQQTWSAGMLEQAVWVWASGSAMQSRARRINFIRYVIQYLLFSIITLARGRRQRVQ